jgi:tRNA(Ile2) C34 agmatinyltransferase TiaS
MTDDIKRMVRDAIDDDEPLCPSCGGPMYTQAHWQYWQCDDCGRREDKEVDEP